ncbi:MAG: glycosyltransferase, partial [Flavobacterium sp.]
NLDADATQILKLWSSPKHFSLLQAAAVNWSRKFTTEYFAEAIHNVLRTANRNFEANDQSTTQNEEPSCRVLQIIDSLQAGGAERMAVQYANALAEKISFSGLVVTRLEGPLQKQLNSDVNYLYLKKKHSIDLKALWRLLQFVKKNKINTIQAHGTSYFFVVLLKCFCPRLQLIWHDHYGESEFLNQRPRVVLKLVAPFFNGVVVVNQKLKLWCENVLKVSNVLYLPNFATVEVNQDKDTILHGIAGKRILCLANLRPQKNHFLLLKVAQKIQELHPDWTFHLVGKDFEDEYSKSLQQTIWELNLEKNVFLYGSKSDIGAIIKQAEIGILTSKSEGLPVALLEYGLYKKAVVVTDVGEVAAVVQSGQNGFLIATEDVAGFQNALLALIVSADLRCRFGESLATTIQQSYSKPAVINNYLQWLQKIKK